MFPTFIVFNMINQNLARQVKNIKIPGAHTPTFHKFHTDTKYPPPNDTSELIEKFERNKQNHRLFYCTFYSNLCANPKTRSRNKLVITKKLIR